jgi:RNA polymerase-binding transcription factor DksA
LIAKARLNAIPYTPVCIKCAERQEHNGGPIPR